MENLKDLDEVPVSVKNSMEIVPVKTIEEITGSKNYEKKDDSIKGVLTAKKGFEMQSLVVEYEKDFDKVLNDPEIGVIVELIGGTTIARDFIIKALNAGKNVVTANKALLAHYGRDLFAPIVCGLASCFYRKRQVPCKPHR